MDDELKKAQEAQVRQYKKLGKLKDTPEYEVFLNFMMKTAVDKMLWVFLTGKDGDNVKSWDEFCKVRGEVVARLHMIQEIYGAEVMATHLERQLNDYYKNVD